MKNIFVTIDFDKKTAYLADYAGMLADKFAAKVWLVHIAAPEPDFVGYDPGPQYIRDIRAHELREEHKNLQALADSLKTKGVEAEALLIQGPTVEMIIKEAESLNADMIITGTHKHSFIYNAFIGSTSLDLFRKSRIALLAVPLSDDE